MRPLAVLASVATLAIPCAAAAQDTAIGEAEYMTSCAQCHGTDAKGAGVLAEFLNAIPPDLTQIQAANGGVFPVGRVYSIIDGSATEGPHGTREMPAWGMRYSSRAPHELGLDLGRTDRDAFARARILALIEYISTIQEE